MVKKSRKTVSVGAVVAELVGTFMLAFAVLASVNGVLASTVPTPVIAGVTLGLAVLSIGGISGSHINPAVTLGLWSIGEVKAPKAAAYIVAQIAGASVALFTMTVLIDRTLTNVAGSADWRILAAEALGAAVFTFGISAAVHQGAKGANAALLIGGSLFLGIVFAATVSAGILNPAVAITLESFNWAYVLGPIAGSIIGMNLYKWIQTESKDIID